MLRVLILIDCLLMNSDPLDSWVQVFIMFVSNTSSNLRCHWLHKTIFSTTEKTKWTKRAINHDMPLIVKTHLDLRNDKCIKIYILESIEYSGGLFNTFIEIKLTYSFIQLFMLSHLLTNSLSHSNKTFVNMKTQSKEAFIINFLSTCS